MFGFDVAGIQFLLNKARKLTVPSSADVPALSALP